MHQSTTKNEWKIHFADESMRADRVFWLSMFARIMLDVCVPATTKRNDCLSPRCETHACARANGIDWLERVRETRRSDVLRRCARLRQQEIEMLKKKQIRSSTNDESPNRSITARGASFDEELLALRGWLEGKRPLLGPFSVLKRCKDVWNSYSAELRAFFRSNRRTMSERRSLNSSTISSQAMGLRSRKPNSFSQTEDEQFLYLIDIVWGLDRSPRVSCSVSMKAKSSKSTHSSRSSSKGSPTYALATKKDTGTFEFGKFDSHGWFEGGLNRRARRSSIASGVGGNERFSAWSKCDSRSYSNVEDNPDWSKSVVMTMTWSVGLEDCSVLAVERTSAHLERWHVPVPFVPFQSVSIHSSNKVLLLPKDISSQCSTRNFLNLLPPLSFDSTICSAVLSVDVREMHRNCICPYVASFEPRTTRSSSMRIGKDKCLRHIPSWYKWCNSVPLNPLPIDPGRECCSIDRE